MPWTHPGTSLFCLFLALLLSGCDGPGAQTADELVQAGKQYELKGDDRSAQISYKSALQIEPENKELRLLLARSYLRSKQGLDAEKEFRQAEKLGVSRMAILTGLGDAMLLAGKHQDVLREIAPPEPMATPTFKAQVLRIRADAQFALMQVREACQAYREAAQLDSSHAQAQWGLARCAQVDKDHTKAIDILTALAGREPRVAEHRMRLGNALRVAGRPREAEAAFGEAIRLAPKEPTAYVHRAQARLLLNNEAGAAADLAEAGKLAPKSPQVIYTQALMDRLRGDLTAARDKLQSVINALYWDYNAVLLYGEVLHGLGDHATAEKQLTRLLAINPRGPDLLHLIAATQLSQGDARRALSTLAPVLTPTQADPTILSLAAQAHLALGDLTQARAHTERALATQPKARDARLLLARIKSAQGQRDAAMSDLEVLAGEDARWGEADALLLELLLRQRQYDRVLDYLAKARPEKRADNPQVEWLLGSAHAGKGNMVLARQHYQRTLSLEPTHMPAALALAFLELKDKQPEAARSVFAAILRQQPDHLEAMQGMAAVELAVERTDEATQWLEKAAKAHPKAIEPRIKLVNQLLRAGNRDKAIVQAKELQSLAPDDPDVLRLLARAQLAIGDPASAVSSLRRAQQVRPGQPDLLLELANAELAMRDTRAARASLDRLLRLQPRSEPARLTLVRVELLEGKHEAALTRARELQNMHPASAGAYILAGDILHLLGRYADAVREYERAEAIRPFGALRVSLVKSLRGAGQAAEAEARLVQWVRDHPQDVLARLHLAALYRETARSADALRQLEYLRRLAPDNALVLNELALTQLLLGNHAAAREAAEKAYQGLSLPAIADTLASVLLTGGEVQRALDLWEKAVATAPASADIRLNYARALLHSKQTAKARQQLDAIQRLPASAREKAEARRLLAGLP